MGATRFGRISRSTFYGEPGFDDYTEDQWHIGYALDHRFNDVFQFRQNVRYAETEQDIPAKRKAGVQADGRTLTRNSNAPASDVQGLTVDNQVQADFSSGTLRHKLLVGSGLPARG